MRTLAAIRRSLEHAIEGAGLGVHTLGADGVRRRLCRDVLEIRVVEVEPVAVGVRIAPHDAAAVEEQPIGSNDVVHELLDARRDPDVLPPGRAAIFSEARGVGREPAAQPRQTQLHRLPDLDVAHVAFGVPDGVAVIQPIADRCQHPCRRSKIERREREVDAAFELAAALAGVAGESISGDDFLAVAAPVERPRHGAKQARVGGNEKAPGRSVRGQRIGRIAPRARREVVGDGEVGAVVDTAIIEEHLTEQDPQRALHAGKRGVEGVRAVGAAHFHGKREIAVGGDFQLDRAVHDRISTIALNSPLGRLGEGDLTEACRPINAGYEPLAYAGSEDPPRFLDGLARELPVVVDDRLRG